MKFKKSQMSRKRTQVPDCLVNGSKKGRADCNGHGAFEVTMSHQEHNQAGEKAQWTLHTHGIQTYMRAKQIYMNKSQKIKQAVAGMQVYKYKKLLSIFYLNGGFANVCTFIKLLRKYSTFFLC